MRAFLVKLAVFVIFFKVGDLLLLKVLEHFRPIDYRLFVDSKREIFDTQQDYDLLILGDSHVSDAMNSKIIDTALGVKSFNLGVYHASPYEWFYLLKASLSHLKTKPKYIVIGTNPKMFYRRRDAGKYSPIIIRNFWLQYQLYANSSTGLDASFFVGFLEQQDLFSAMASKLFGKAYKPTREIKSVYSGYLESTNHNYSKNWTRDDLGDHKWVEDQAVYLERLIDLAQTNDIHIIFVNVPVWGELQEAREFNPAFLRGQEVLAKLSNSRRLETYNRDYHFGRINLEMDDFLNPEHLNGFGAQKFTSAFCTWFKQKNSLDMPSR